MWARIGAALKNNLIFYAVLTVSFTAHHQHDSWHSAMDTNHLLWGMALQCALV